MLAIITCVTSLQEKVKEIEALERMRLLMLYEDEEACMLFSMFTYYLTILCRSPAGLAAPMSKEVSQYYLY